MKDIHCTPDGAGVRVGLAVARFNATVTDMLLEGCLAALAEHGVDDGDITVVRVPGAWELPGACRRLAADHHAVIALGAVIRGETAHFDFISAECARGLGQVAADTGVPVGFGVLTADNAGQAMKRADPARRDKGREAALAALEMVAVHRALDREADHGR